MLKLPRSTNQTLVLAVAFVALANLGCGTTIAGKYPHLDRRSVCIRVPGIEQDSAEFIFSADNVPISNFHPDVIDRVAPTARTVFDYDPNADPLSPRYLPAPYDRLQCPEQFSMLPSSEPQQSPLPEASLDLYVHKPRSESKRVPDSVAEKLANCPSTNAARLGAISYTVNFNVYVTDDGQAVSAYVQHSTLGDRETEACMLEVLRTAQWSVPELPAIAAVPPGARMFFAQPQPAATPPESGPISEIRPKARPLLPPAGEPLRMPRIFVIPLGPFAAAAAVFGAITLLPSKLAPAWSAEINPITQQRYTSPKEYEEVQRLSPQEIQQRRRAHIKATQPPAPPAPTPAHAPAPQPQPAPSPQEQRAAEKKAQQCLKIASDIWDLIYTKREETTGDRPNGYQGLAKRWEEYAENRGKWGPQPDGGPGKKQKNHLAEYVKHQGRLVEKLKDWKGKECDDKDLPRLALQYAVQKPELGPGKPLKPAPTPTWSSAVVPAISPPKDRKRAK